MVVQKSRFGEELDKLLQERGMNQKQLAQKMQTSDAYVSSIATGKRNVSPARVSSIASTLSADSLAMTRLHRAAAIDAGFQIELPEDFDED